MNEAFVATFATRDELLDFDAQLQIMQLLPRQPLWLPIIIMASVAAVLTLWMLMCIMRALQRQHDRQCRLRALRAHTSRRAPFNKRVYPGVCIISYDYCHTSRSACCI